MYEDAELISGTIKYPNYDVYQGEIKDYKPHGHGRFTYLKNGSGSCEIYDGEFYKGMKYGKGAYCSLKEGIKPEKVTNFDKFDSGLMQWAYIGEFEEDEINGHGVMETIEHAIKGYFFNGELEGDFKLVEKLKSK